MAGINCGGWSETMDATKETQKICDQVKDQVEKETGQVYKVYTALKYRLQIVEGENLLIQVLVGGEDCIHLQVYQRPRYVYDKQDPLPELQGVEQHKTREDHLVPFIN